jgi:predicted polyphosphate/ATP-dependent NAD kinase
MDAVAADVVRRMETAPDALYIVGPGSTTRAIAARLGLAKTLIGVDVIAGGRIVAVDANEAQLLALLAPPTVEAYIVVTPIGGQGFLFGRGNQPISPRVITRVGRERIIVVSTPGKIHALGGRPLRVDSGDRAVDEMLSRHVRVVTGYGEQIVYKVTA